MIAARRKGDGDFGAMDVAACILLFCIIFFSGCTASTGDLKRDAEVTKQFKAYRVIPDHRYYYVGPRGRPDAVIGIRLEFTLDTDLWVEIDLEASQLKKWVRWMDSEYGQRTRRYPYGSRIVGPGGENIGVWYSIYRWTTVQLNADNRVAVFPPRVADPMDADRSPMDRRME